MNRFVVLVCTLGLALSGCGPLQAPLPARLDDEQQKSVNQFWENTLSPADRFNNQSLLDILITTNTYQLGVDRLEFRSEKNYSGGVVVMEVHYDRLAPERDLFTVTVQDRQGKILRQERYGREQIETTYRELLVELGDLRRKREQGIASPEELQKLKSYEVREACVESAFPNHLENNGKSGNGQQKAKQ